ncbi:uncharacterized protein V1518DRAFT_420467 [Limtongia smithiae]|uniref:uncharacterized protein n=1 Tax=Limtongia smithiae TaxID=1125753 RepID=UPI0034CDA2DC
MSSGTNGSAYQTHMIAERILCVADIRGNLGILNQLAKEHNASYIIHTGDFGFYDKDSVPKITDKTLRHVAQYSSLLDARTLPPDPQSLRHYLTSRPISQLQQFLSGELKLDVPVYTVHGACEDVSVLERFRSGEYSVPNMFVVDEHSTFTIDTQSGVRLRLLGLGGALVMHKLFDNGSGRTTIAGGGGTTWTTLLQIGELIDTAARTFDETETRILITHASPAREGILAQLALSLKADFSISGGLHFRYGCSYNEFAVNPSYDAFRNKLAYSRSLFMDVWDMVKAEVQPVIANNPTQKQLMDNALAVIMKMPTQSQQLTDRGREKEEAANVGFRNLWHFNLADVSYGTVVLNLNDGKIGLETKCEGFNFKYKKPGSSTQASSLAPSRGISSSKAVLPQQQQPRKAPINGIAPAPVQPTVSAPAPPAPLPVQATAEAPAAPTSEAEPASTEAAAREAPTDVLAITSSSSPALSTTLPPTANDDTSALPTGPTATREHPQRRIGLWVARAGEDEEALRSNFTPEDQANITGIQIRKGQTGKRFAYVLFDTQDNATAALQRVDQEKLGKVTPINDLPPRPMSGASRPYAAGAAGASSGMSRPAPTWNRERSEVGTEGSSASGVPTGTPGAPSERGAGRRMRVSGGSHTIARGRASRGRGGGVVGSALSGAPVNDSGESTTSAPAASAPASTPAPASSTPPAAAPAPAPAPAPSA